MGWAEAIKNHKAINIAKLRGWVGRDLECCFCILGSDSLISIFGNVTIHSRDRVENLGYFMAL